jgi:hypothetical protein
VGEITLESLGTMVVYSIAFVRLLRNSDFTVSELSVEADMVVLYPAVIPAPNAIGISQMLEVTRDRLRFMEELHGRLHAPQSKIKGIYLAGACQSPMSRLHCVCSRPRRRCIGKCVCECIPRTGSMATSHFDISK